MIAQLYPYLLFVHVASALALFAGEGALYLALRSLLNARSAGGVRAALARAAEAGRVPHIASFLLLASGLAMAVLVWGFARAWVNLALLVFFLIFVQVSLVDAPGFRRLTNLSRFGTPEELLEAAHDPTLLRWAKLRLGATFGLVYLMTVKPPLLGSVVGVGLITLAAALVAFGPLLVQGWREDAPKRAAA